MASTAPVPHPIPGPLAELIAQRFKVLAEPMRIKLLDCLRESDKTVGEMQAAPGVSQQNRLEAPRRPAQRGHGDAHEAGDGGALRDR